MNFVEMLRLAFNSLRSHKLRAGLTTLGVMIGVMTVIGMLALIDGLNHLVAGQLASLGTNTLYIQKFPWSFSRESFLLAQKRRNLTLADADAIEKRMTLARRVAPMMQMPVSVRSGATTLEAVQLLGTTPPYQYISDFRIVAGRQMTTVDLNQERRVAMVGATIVNEFFPVRDPIGQEILIGRNHFEIIAVFEKRGSLFGSDQDNFAMIPITAFTRLFSGPVTLRGGESVTIAVQPQSPEVIDRLRDEIISLLRRRRSIPPGEENDFNINTADQLMQTYQTITSGVFGLMIGVTALSLVVGGIGIMNIMLVSVSERIREIGIRKAVGARRRDILTQFLLEAITLSCVGGIIGTVLGFVVAWGVAQLIHLPAAVSWWSVLLGFGFSAMVGVFFGWYPAKRAAAMNPIEALRYE